MSDYAPADVQRKLIDACNYLCEFVSDNLAEGFELTVELRKGEASLSLIDPSGDEVEIGTADSGISTIDEACVASREWLVDHPFFVE